MKRSVLPFIAIAIFWISGCADEDCGSRLCSEHFGVSPEYSVTQSALEARCSINVSGKGSKNMEDDYVPNVVWCENGNSNTEGLRAQAVSARSFAYYKGNSIGDGQNDQVYSCPSRAPNAEQLGRTKAATNATAGVVLRYHDTTVCAFYVSGSKVANLDSNCKSSTSEWPQSNVTYNWGKSGDNIKQSPIGSQNPKVYANRGCMSQNGATCLGNKGWVWENIARFFYGMDIQIVHTTGSCITHPNCQTKVSNNTIIDDTDECFVRNAMEKWYVLNSGNGGSSQFAYTLSGSPSSTGTWTVNVATAGTYEIFANIDGAHGARSNKAPYTVRAKGQEKTVNVDISGSGWISIGKFEFATGGDQWVKLTDASGEAYTDDKGKRVVFDALKFVTAEACKDTCTTEGAKQCSGNGFQTCTDTNNDGCKEWSSVTDCGEGKKCSGAGECVESCADECSEGQKKCSGDTAYLECGQFDGDSCREWSPSPAACGNGEVCSNGECVTSCTNACAEGNVECLDDTSGYRVCAKGAAGCMEWGDNVPCSEGTYCSAGKCIPVPDTCTNECTKEGEVECADESSYHNCVQLKDCLVWSDPQNCEEGKVCEDGVCIEGEKPPVESETDVDCVTEIDGRPTTIIDDSDACFERVDPSSAIWMTLAEGYMNNLYYAYLRKDMDEAKGIWHLNVTKAGKYTIQAHVLGGVGSVRNLIKYTVYASGKKTYPTVSVDEDSTWVTLGNFELKKGKSQFVMLSNLVDDDSELVDDEGNEIRVLYDAIKVIADEEETPSPGEEENKGKVVDSVMPSISIAAPSGCSVSGQSGHTVPIWMILGVAVGFGLIRRRRCF